MCRICEDDYPKIETPNVIKLAALADNVDHFGAMHIVIEDGNVEPEHIAWCLEQDDATDDDRAFGEFALTLTEDEIVSAIAKHDGYW